MPEDLIANIPSMPAAPWQHAPPPLASRPPPSLQQQNTQLMDKDSMAELGKEINIMVGRGGGGGCAGLGLRWAGEEGRGGCSRLGSRWAGEGGKGGALHPTSCLCPLLHAPAPAPPPTYCHP